MRGAERDRVNSVQSDRGPNGASPNGHSRRSGHSGAVVVTVVYGTVYWTTPYDDLDISAVMVRVAVDVAQDPTSHNLWPLEIVIAVVFGGLWGLIAAGVGELMLRVRH